jgi:hypothetical protein
MATFNYETTAPNGNANNTNQTIVGTSGDDVIIAGPASPLYFGRNGAVRDNDDVTGGGGNDQMTGGYDNDIFRFNFTEVETIETGTFTIGSSFELNGITYNMPSTNASANAWANWDAAVDSYVQSVLDANPEWDVQSFGEAVTTNTNPGRNQPSVTTTYTTSINWSKTVTQLQGEGDDVITDFSSADQLIFSGVPADWETYLSSSQSDAGTLIDYDGGSLLLQGVSTDISSLLNSGGLTFA